MVGIYLICFITKEVDLFEAFILDVPQAVGLVPSSGKDIKRYLSADGVGKVVVRELLLQDFYESGPHAMNLSGRIQFHAIYDDLRANLVVSFELVTLCDPKT